VMNAFKKAVQKSVPKDSRHRDNPALKDIINKTLSLEPAVAPVPEPVSLDVLKNKVKDESGKDRGAPPEKMNALKDLIMEKTAAEPAKPVEKAPEPKPTMEHILEPEMEEIPEPAKQKEEPEKVQYQVQTPPPTFQSTTTKTTTTTTETKSSPDNPEPKEVPEDVLRKILEE
jgi:hypothetical protein